MSLTKAQKWLRTINWLRREFPSRYPVTIRSKPAKKGSGDSDFRGRRFYIRINSRKPYSERIDTILHEWAHVLTWFGAGRAEDHSDEWGLWYAKLYRNWERIYGEKKEET